MMPVIVTKHELVNGLCPVNYLVEERESKGIAIIQTFLLFLGRRP